MGWPVLADDTRSDPTTQKKFDLFNKAEYNLPGKHVGVKVKSFLIINIYVISASYSDVAFTSCH
jgi:hypothetical protein